ncbi:hypothetical protein GCM10007939_18900 [Amylibacter marinus]|uniref:Uncharacterized protein n=1 Tax=Amylibacter marinus TaxID=1475483 RepID=A0ABQ5VW01_9RHOB|nr:hypothetical protein GCM10007939_18900 [Amylibacter marinus]
MRRAVFIRKDAHQVWKTVEKIPKHLNDPKITAASDLCMLELYNELYDRLVENLREVIIEISTIGRIVYEFKLLLLVQSR